MMPEYDNHQTWAVNIADLSDKLEAVLYERVKTRMAVPEPVSLCFNVTYAETQTNNLGVSLDAVS